MRPFLIFLLTLSATQAEHYGSTPGKLVGPEPQKCEAFFSGRFRTIPTGRSSVYGLTRSSDEVLLAGEELRRLNLVTGESNHVNPASTVLGISADGTRAYVQTDEQISAVEAASGKTLGTHRLSKGEFANVTDGGGFIVVRPGGRRLNGKLKHVVSPDLVGQFPRQASADGKYLLVENEDGGKGKIIETATGKTVTTVPLQRVGIYRSPQTVLFLANPPSLMTLAAGYESVEIFPLDGGKSHSIKFPFKVWSFSPSTDGKTLRAAGEGLAKVSLPLGRIEASELILKRKPRKEVWEKYDLSAANLEAKWTPATTISPDGRFATLLVNETKPGVISLFDFKTHRERWALETGADEVPKTTFSRRAIPVCHDHKEPLHHRPRVGPCPQATRRPCARFGQFFQ